ncbi:oxidoreductase, 2OG-Fe(II) oxygenase family protein [Mucor ambiguus]|uniref:Oxidoreductase, 2OG-Fe(II) oxygenase family protein n=1 Tax=Mucor ambiguus TaxID=91626 RepID=A0A0C9LZM0_9FUNG|nr:oxidoreductase, 2OG-Fe(II) oxygenase family protein [Mucor ambiguus]
MSHNIDWEDLFGSDDEDEAVEQDENTKQIITFDAIPGLKLIKQALSHQEQMSLTHALIDRNYFTGNANQAMLFGELPNFIKWIEPWIVENYPDLFGQDILNRQPLFDQAILNMYKKGEGITSHVDLLRFEDGILIISLMSSCIMTMRPARKDATSYHAENTDDNNKYDILLCPGDVLALSQEARYDWEHGIPSQLVDEMDGQKIERGTRISVTLRRLKHGEEIQSTTATTSKRSVHDAQADS